MLMITGYLKTTPNEVEAVLADLRTGMPRTRGEDGCLFYDFVLADAAKGTILAVERWRDQAALDAHLSTPEMAALLGKWSGKIEIDVRKHDVSNERGFTD